MNQNIYYYTVAMYCACRSERNLVLAAQKNINNLM